MARMKFKGGIHPAYNKDYTSTLAITEMPPPAKVVIPMVQHIGAPCEPVVQVEKGTKVKVGQMLGDSGGFVSAPIHSSVSGNVTDIGLYNHPCGRKITAATIESDGLDEWDTFRKTARDYKKMTPETIRKAIRKSGLVGLGGATFPTHVKLAPPPDKSIDTVIINGAECEPYLTADHRIMLEHPGDVLTGLKIMIKALGAEKGIIGIEENKPDALRVMEKLCEDQENITVVPLETKYPQGAEKMLIYVTTRREVPSGGLPLDIGVVNHNVGTAVAITKAIAEGRPLIERVLTVTGPGVNTPANLLVRIGTLVSDVIDYCGGLKDETLKLLIGGPMMGLAQPNTDLPVIKGTSGILALTDQDVYLSESSPCIRCAKCVDACPVYLLPTSIAQSAEHNLFSRAEKLHALDCFECGCCSFVCPSKIPLTQLIRIAKAEIMNRKRK